MSELISKIHAAIFYDEPIEDLVPMDLTGCGEEDRRSIYYLYAKYGRDPERRIICSRKLEEVRHATGR